MCNDGNNPTYTLGDIRGFTVIAKLDETVAREVLALAEAYDKEKGAIQQQDLLNILGNNKAMMDDFLFFRELGAHG